MVPDMHENIGNTAITSVLSHEAATGQHPVYEVCYPLRSTLYQLLPNDTLYVLQLLPSGMYMMVAAWRTFATITPEPSLRENLICAPSFLASTVTFFPRVTPAALS